MFKIRERACIRLSRVMLIFIPLACDSRSDLTSLEPRSDGSADAGPAPVATSDAADAGAANPDLSVFTLNVVDSSTETPSPVDGASVRIEGRGEIVETLTDVLGHAAAAVHTGSGPWDVTVARAGFIAVSVINVSGPIEQPLHLNPLAPRSAQPPQNSVRAVLSGAVRGRSLQPRASSPLGYAS